MEVLSDLNPQQRAAVEHGEGPLLILAGAGSGKTRVITHRIAHLVGHYRIPATAILAMTFTNKAADVMAQRVRSLLGGAPSPLIGTFHSFCVRVLRQEGAGIGIAPNFTIYAEDEQLRLVKSLSRQLGLDDRQLTPRAILSRISAAKNRGWRPAEFRAQSADPRSERVAALYELYQQALRQATALDFDDLLLETERLLRESEPARERYRRQYRHVLVDEYQDTNRTQYQLLRQLTAESGNLCAVGDEDQSIYSWRGADLRNILDFERDYPQATIIRLEENYRSTGNILAAAAAVVANNVERKGKKLWTQAGPGAALGYYLASEAEGEAAWVAQTIRELVTRHREAHIGVLYRTNAQSRVFEEALRRQEIGYRVVGGFSFYERAEVRDLLAYVRAALNPHDSISLLRIINSPARGIGETTVTALERTALQHNLSVWGALERALQVQGGLAPRTQAALAGFYQLMATLHASTQAQMPVDELLKQAIDASGYARALQQEGTPEAESRLENLSELVNAAAAAAASGETTIRFLDHAALVSDQDAYDETATVQLMTLHSAKGLEFSTVFLVGLEEGLFPHRRGLDSPAQMEEERRLCYVGMTRARQRLYLSHAARRRRYGGTMSEPTEPSRFLAEVPAELLPLPAALREPPGLRYVREGYDQDAGSRSEAVTSIHQFFGRGGRPATSGARPPAAGAAAAGPPRFGGAPRSKAGVVSAGGLRMGARVRHSRYGTGTVLQIEGEGEGTKLTISFPGYGLRKMLEKAAGLTPL